jgi:hypothetical protein
MIQTSFAAGEIAPSLLYARVDLAKYHIAAKLLRNFFVWVHGGASNRAGTEFVGRCYNSQQPVHLIPFQFNLVQTYVLEFGHYYMRVIMNSSTGGAGYVLEPAYTIANITNNDPVLISLPINTGPYNNGDQVYVAGTGTPLDSTPARQYLVANSYVARAGLNFHQTFTLTDLNGNPINATSFPSWGGSGTIARVYTLATPYAGQDVQALKWTQSADTMTLCHPSYMPADLTRTQHWAWALTNLSFAPTVAAPAGLTFTNTAGTSGYTDTKWQYSYVVTAVSASPPDESFASAPATKNGVQLNSADGAYNSLSWTPITAAQYYRIYKAQPTYNLTITPANVMYGYIGTAYGPSFVDTEIAPDFTQTPPQGTDPFVEGQIGTVSVIDGGSGYDDTIEIIATDIAGTGAIFTPTVVSGVITAVTVTNGGKNYQNPSIQPGNQGSGAVATITTAGGIAGGAVVSVKVLSGGQDYFGDLTITAASGGTGATFIAEVSNGVITAIHGAPAPTGPVGLGGIGGGPPPAYDDPGGSGYTNGDSLVFTQSGGSGATFSATVAPGGNFPSCATYFQQRKVFAGSNQSPQTIWMTQPADFKNMDVSNPSQASDAIVMTIAANQVNAIKWLVPMNNLVVLTAGGAWLLVGGAITSPIAVTPTNTVVVPQNYVGCADLPPIVINYDILYVQAKGSIVRDLAYNFWVNVYTFTTI